MKLYVKDPGGDRFLKDEAEAVSKYMEAPEGNDRRAAAAFLRSGGKTVTDSHRPCCASIVVKRIRNKIRVYVHLTVEGRAMPKYDRYGRPRHVWGKGRVGCDIGTQTAAWTSEAESGLSNLAERGDTIRHQERQQRLAYRAMDRSRRANNPGNYNADGTVRKGRKAWKESGRYKKLRERHRELCRRNAESRKYANREMANRMRTLGDEFITEPKNASKLMRKAKKTEISEKTGKYKKKKRFGKSVQSRCPGGFQADVKALFESTGGSYHETGPKFRASQYDHTADDYVKKKLSERMYRLAGGQMVQRDWYSSFLMFCSDVTYENASLDRCIGSFSRMYEKERAMVKRIAASGKKVMNSGIKPQMPDRKEHHGFSSVRQLPIRKEGDAATAAA